MSTDLAKLKSRGDVTDNGVAFGYDLHRDGAFFYLYREPHHTRKDISFAKHYLRQNRDVIGFQVIKYGRSS